MHLPLLLVLPLDLWQELDLLLVRHDVRFRVVKGHSGHPENERADELADLATREMGKLRSDAKSEVQGFTKMVKTELEEVLVGDADVDVGSTVRRMYTPEKGEGAEMLEGSSEDVAARIAQLLNEKRS